MAKWENDIDKLFQESLKGAEFTPPPVVKSNVNKALFGKGFFRIGLIVGLLLLIGGSVTWYSVSKMNDGSSATNIDDIKLANNSSSMNSDDNHSAQNGSNNSLIQKEGQADNNTSTLSANHEQTNDAVIGINSSSSDDKVHSGSKIARPDNSLINKDNSFSKSDSKVDASRSYGKKNYSKFNSSDQTDMASNIPSNRKSDGPRIDTPRNSAKNINKSTDPTGISNSAGFVKVDNNKSQFNFDKNVTSIDSKMNEIEESNSFNLDKEDIDALKKIRSNELAAIEFNNKPFKAKPRFELMGQFGIGSNHIGFRNSDSDSTNSLFFANSSPSYGFDVNARMNIKNWYVTSGINYSYKQFDFNKSYTTTELIQTGTQMQIDSTLINDTLQQWQIDTSFVPVYEEQISNNEASMRMKLQTISIPLKFGYRFAFSKFYLHLGAGVQFNMPISTNLRSTSGESFMNSYISVKDSPYKSMNMQLLFETELQYRFNDHWGLSINPRYGYQLTPVFKSDVNFIPNKHMGSISIGLHYHF